MRLINHKYVQKLKETKWNQGFMSIMILVLGMILGGLLFSGEPTSDHTSTHKIVNHTNTTWTCSMHPQIQLEEAGQCPICFMDLIPLVTNNELTNTTGVEQKRTTWTCSMDPQVKLDEAGQCPICFMDLIPLVSDNNGYVAEEISLSLDAIKIARIETTPVRQGTASGEFFLSGKIDYDETRIKNIAAWFPGRLERLYVDYTGIRVNEGDHLLEIYSPELYSTQTELLQAYHRMNLLGQSPSVQASSRATYEAVVEKAKLLGLSMAQINAIANSGTARSVLQINSPMTGIVIQKNALEGKYVKTGEPIYSIADLSKVWLILDAYEKDLPWLSYGQELTFSVAGLPGKTFNAHISYIDPLVNEEKRSVTVRAVLDNQMGLLKPGMLAEATISVMFNGKGQVVSPDLSGKWACPMHPEVINDQPGACSICGMDLVSVQGSHISPTLVTKARLIPASSVLRTGRRALVYVQTNHDESIKFALREIELGPRVGSEYIVLDGLSIGEQVVSKGNFKIDSAMQIAGNRSMMSGEHLSTELSMEHQHD